MVLISHCSVASVLFVIVWYMYAGLSLKHIYTLVTQITPCRRTPYKQIECRLAFGLQTGFKSRYVHLFYQINQKCVTLNFLGKTLNVW